MTTWRKWNATGAGRLGEPAEPHWLQDPDQRQEGAGFHTGHKLDRYDNVTNGA